MYNITTENMNRVVNIVCITNAWRTLTIAKLKKQRSDDVLTVDDERELALLMREQAAECRGAIRLFIALDEQASSDDNRATARAASWN